MVFTVVKLFSRFPLRWHLGLGSLDRSDVFPRSDTLFSALGNAFLLLYGEKELATFLDTLWVSSVFWGVRGKEEDCLFFPVPLAMAPPKSLVNRKTFKKIRFASWKAFTMLVDTFDSETCSFSFDDQEEGRWVVWNSRYLVTPEEARWLGEGAVTVAQLLEPHVVLDREANRSQSLYFEEDTWMGGISENHQPFLFFLCAWNGRMEPVLRLFVEEGLGGERFQGRGRFDWFDVETLDIPQEGDYLVLFSLAKPKEEEVPLLLAYDLVKRGGFIFRGEPLGMRKNPHYKLVEGSLVRLPFTGENLDVSPILHQPVISYGKALGFAFFGKGGKA